MHNILKLLVAIETFSIIWVLVMWANSALEAPTSKLPPTPELSANAVCGVKRHLEHSQVWRTTLLKCAASILHTTDRVTYPFLICWLERDLKIFVLQRNIEGVRCWSLENAFLFLTNLYIRIFPMRLIFLLDFIISIVFTKSPVFYIQILHIVLSLQHCTSSKGIDTPLCCPLSNTASVA